MSRSKRRKLWIEARIQGALARRIVMHWAMFFVIAFTFSVVFQFLSDPFMPFAAYWTTVWKVHGPLLLTMVLILPAFLYDSVKLSNRFVGPIIRFRNSIRDLSRGQPVKPIEFRGDDFWKELADDFNGMIEKVQSSEAFQATTVVPRESRQSVDSN